MIYLSQIVDEIKTELQSGVSYDDSRFDTKYIESKIHGARAVIISNYMIRVGKFINDAWVQTLDINFADRETDCEVVEFDCPSVITVDGHNDGFVYVGHVSGMKPFARIRKGYTNLTQHSLFSKSKSIFWDFKHLTQGRTVLQFFNNKKLENVMVRAMFNDPTFIPNFDKQLDPYPVDANLKKDIVEMVVLDLIRKVNQPTVNNPESLGITPR